MAYLTKEQYDRRRENAAARSIKNEEIAVENGMTEEQAGIISELCTARHEMHCNMDRLVHNNDKLKDLIEINSRLRESGIDFMRFIPSYLDAGEYIDIDDFDLLYEIEKVPEDDDERKEWYDSNYARIYDELSQLNDDIEKYLASIDERYHTHFCPTGALRIM